MLQSDNVVGIEMGPMSRKVSSNVIIEANAAGRHRFLSPWSLAGVRRCLWIPTAALGIVEAIIEFIPARRPDIQIPVVASCLVFTARKSH
jgi:hypothetical protein